MIITTLTVWIRYTLTDINLNFRLNLKFRSVECFMILFKILDLMAESLGNSYLFPNSGGVDRILLSKCHFVPPRRRTSRLDTSVIDC